MANIPRQCDAILEAVSFSAKLLIETTWEESIQRIIEYIGKVTGVSRVYISEKHRANDGTLLTSRRYEWVMKGITPQIDNPELQNFPLTEDFARWLELLNRGEVVYGHIREFPEVEQKVLSSQDIKSILIVPISVNHSWWGIIGFDECLNEREWSLTEINALKAVAGILGSAIQRGLTEKKLEENEKKYRTTFEYTGTAMTVVEEDTTISLVNEEFERLSGYSKVEIEGKMSWTQFVHPDDLERMKNYHYARRRSEDVPKKYEFRFIDRLGNTKNIFITIDIIPGTKKSVASLIDITFIKKINNLLKAVSEINEVVAREKKPETVLKTVCRELGLIYDAAFVSLKKGEKLIPVESEGIDIDFINKIIEYCPAIQKAAKGDTVSINNESVSCGKCKIQPRKFVLSLPLNIHDQNYGVLAFHSYSRFSEDEVLLLERIAKNIAFALSAYEVEERERLTIEQLVTNLVQFDKTSDRLRNPLAVIMGSLELTNEIGEKRVIEIINEQVKRIRRELDRMRREEIKTYHMIKNRISPEKAKE